MRVKFWDVRGSVPVADGHMMRYGGNTSCVEVTLGDGTEIILDAGTGIRGLSAARSGEIRSAQILLTHLHLDHIQGLLFFASLFDPRNRVEVYGPLQVGPDLQVRLARYLSEPLSPVEIRELPATVSFTACPDREWELGPARIRAASVHHRGVTLGYRITEGDAVLSYIPDPNPGLAGTSTRTKPNGSRASASLKTHRSSSTTASTATRSSSHMSAGVTLECPTRWLSRGAPAPNRWRSFTTIPFTMTQCSTISNYRRRSTGEPSDATRRPSPWHGSRRYSTCANSKSPCGPARRHARRAAMANGWRSRVARGRSIGRPNGPSTPRQSARRAFPGSAAPRGPRRSPAVGDRDAEVANDDDCTFRVLRTRRLGRGIPS
jgi:phosphoribosyl 1,2-cyclic phosphodiesterase